MAVTVDVGRITTVTGGSGGDTATIQAPGIYSINLGNGDDSLGVDEPIQATAHGGGGNDTFDVSYSNAQIYGDLDEDSIEAYYGAYTVFGCTGPVDSADGPHSINVSYRRRVDYGIG